MERGSAFEILFPLLNRRHCEQAKYDLAVNFVDKLGKTSAEA